MPIIWLLLAFCGCARSPQVTLQLDSIFKHPENLLPAAGSGPATVSFTEACQQAALLDETMAALRKDMIIAEIDGEQARSLILPRFEVGVTGQIPIAADVEDHSDLVRGGVFLHYDLQKALFYKDASSVAKANVLKLMAKTREAASRIVENLYSGMSNQKYCRNVLAFRQQQLDNARKGLHIADTLVTAGRIAPGVKANWAAQERSLALELMKDEKNLQQVEYDLRRSIGLQPGEEISISESDVFRKLSADAMKLPGQIQSADLLSEVWHQRPLCKIAELDLFMAEMAIIDAQRQRLPNLSASLGLGSVGFGFNGEEAPAVIELHGAMPLYDAGDTTRMIKRAKANREWVYQEACRLARRILNEIEMAANDVRRVEKLKNYVGQSLEEMIRDNDAYATTLMADTANQLDALTLQISTGSAQIELQKAEMELSQSLIKYRYVSGQELAPDIVDRMLTGLTGS